MHFEADDVVKRVEKFGDLMAPLAGGSTRTKPKQ
jgi:hypothetical protein